MMVLMMTIAERMIYSTKEPMNEDDDNSGDDDDGDYQLFNSE